MTGKTLRDPAFPRAGRWRSVAVVHAAAIATLCCASHPAHAAQAAPSAKDARVEIQMSVCAPPDDVVRALELRTRGAPYDVWLWDDATQGLLARGLRLRLRAGAHGGELTLKVANQDCARIAADLVPPGEGKCEYDSHGEEVAGAVSLTRKIDAATTRDLIAGREDIGQALGAAQVRYLRDVAHAWPLPDGLRALGPIAVRTYRSARKSYDVDVSTLPSGEHNVEISSKVTPASMGERRVAMLHELAAAKLALCADQSGQAGNKLRSLQGARPATP